MEKYLREQGGKSFAELPLNDVDLLIFAQLSYCDFLCVQHGETLCEAAQDLLYAPESKDITEQRFDFQEEDSDRLLLYIAAAKRYRAVRVGDFERKCDSENMQFAALLLRADGKNIVVYRGTDNTLAGWKEDFDLCFRMPVAAQGEALAFFERAAAENSLPFVITGHSKGGGLALYASLYAEKELRSRISSVVSFDGVGLPGQALARIESDAACQDILSRIRVILPEASIVGVIFPQPGTVRTVDCRSVSLMQHYLFNWRVENADFVDSKRTLFSRAAAITMDEFLDMLTLTEREKMVTLIYEIIRTTHAQTLEDLLHGWLKNTVPVAKAILKRLDTENAKLYIKVITSFYRALGRTAGLLLGGEEENAKGMNANG